MTPAQNAIIKADILANPDLAALPPGPDGSFAIAALYNLPASPAFKVWRTDAQIDAILDGIDFTKYTPVDVPELTGIYTARAQAIQIKQMNLQNMIQGRSTLNAAKVNIRASLRDAVIQIPAGAGGISASPGGSSGVNVLNACLRDATRLEKLLCAESQASDTTGTVTARVMTFEGSVSYLVIEEARNS